MGTMTKDCNEHVHCEICEIPCDCYKTVPEMLDDLKVKGWSRIRCSNANVPDKFYCSKCKE